MYRKTCRGEIKWITAATLNSIGVASGLIDPKATFHFKISSVNPPLGDIRELLVTIFDKRGLTHWSVVKHESFMLLISGSYSMVNLTLTLNMNCSHSIVF